MMSAIGIDRMRLINVSINSIDLNRYNGHIVAGDGIKIKELNIGQDIEVAEIDITIKGNSNNEKDNYLMKLKLNRIPYLDLSIDVNAPRVLYGTNEVNISDINDMHLLIKEIKDKFSKVGIDINLDKAIISNFEVNYNSHNPKLLDTFKLIKKSLDKEDEKVFLVDHNGETESLMINLSDRKIKIYNKTKQLEDTGQVVIYDNTLRVEVSTSNTMLIRRLCKSKVATIDKFIMNFDNLKLWFIDTVRKRIKLVIERYCNDIEENIYNRLIKGERYYNILLGVATNGDIVDMIIFDNAVKRYYKDTGKKKPNTVIKNYHRKLREYDEELYQKIVNNLAEINKLFEDIEVNFTTLKVG
ncbi:Uncharacterised protein [[Clostridium] sordellii]|uniref:hypothetical protein n=1 Tax=Paraclostridium sordellii TaxID=1505 RepID=UPI0005DE4616|nr:hypothetical protein [Paeniclostridium sordellii]CEN25159.1 Uncharacterised protein [[Clostridium] sordellii] [Paeniclostridium sordellii]